MLVVLMLLCNIIVKAQFKPLAEGATFEEPEEGFAKILQLKNGNTMFIHITYKKGINIRMYNAAHQETAVTHIDPSYGKLDYGNIEAAFELAGNAVLMISEVDSRTPMLYRLVIDGKTGNLKDDQKIGELAHVSFFWRLRYGLRRCTGAPFFCA